MFLILYSCHLFILLILWDVSRILARCLFCMEMMIGIYCCPLLCALFFFYIISGRVIVLEVSSLFLVMQYVTFGSLKCFKVVVGYFFLCVCLEKSVGYCVFFNLFADVD